MQVIKIKKDDNIIIYAGLLIDGKGNPPRENVVLTVESGCIRSISQAPAGSLTEPDRLPCSTVKPWGPSGYTGSLRPGGPAQPCDSGRISFQPKVNKLNAWHWHPWHPVTLGDSVVRFYDLSGYTLLPGLIDCHIHLALDGRDFARSLKRWDDPAAASRLVESRLADTLAAGVVAVRDGGDRPMLVFRYRAEKHGAAVLPRIIACGTALRKKGRYGSFLGRGIEPAGLTAAVAGLAAQGIDQVKVLASGIVSFKQYGLVGPVQFDRGELESICDAAHGLGLKVMAHASSDAAVRAAVLAGADSIEHGYFVSKDTLSLMAEKGTAWVPTIVPVASRLESGMRRYHTPDEIAVIERTCRRQQEMAAYAHEQGVSVGAGTDSGATGVRHGLSFVEELKLLAEAGLSSDQVIHIATGKSAAITGTSADLGAVEPGRPSCMIAVHGNLLKNIDLLRKPSFLFSHVS